jgi:glutamyl-Q tRNA(Asp) synthetase
MDDLDTPRVIPGAADDIMATLEALSLTWDGAVIHQSRRVHRYQEVLENLQSLGVCYPCGCSRSEIARIASAPHASAESPLYPGTCRLGLPTGKSPRSFRLRVDTAVIAFDDLVQGPCSQDLARSCGDFVVRRADGPFAYHLAVVVDDHDTGVDQVVRGADLQDSTPRQIYLQGLLGFTTPSYAHLPLVTGPGGAKLSKRDSAVSLRSGRDLFRDGGSLLADALRFLGQHLPPELRGAPSEDVLAWGRESFDPTLIPGSPAPFHQQHGEST